MTKLLFVAMFLGLFTFSGEAKAEYVIGYYQQPVQYYQVAPVQYYRVAPQPQLTVYYNPYTGQVTGANYNGVNYTVGPVSTNTGYGNYGTNNNGHYNVGDHNNGSFNNGNHNNGSFNRGNHNNGNFNNGNHNSGNFLYGNNRR